MLNIIGPARSRIVCSEWLLELPQVVDASTERQWQTQDCGGADDWKRGRKADADAGRRKRVREERGLPVIP